MKKIGIIGGVAWLSTVEYYKAICRFSEQRHRHLRYDGAPPMPEISIESMNMNYSYGLRGIEGDEASWRGYDEYFRSALSRLETSGAEFVIIASNTPHNRFDTITRDRKVPVINIFDVVANECERLGIDQILLLGTAPTMSSAVFPKLLMKRGISGKPPESASDRSLVVETIAYLQSGRAEGAATVINAIINREFAAQQKSRKAVCLACTELPLAFHDQVESAIFEIADVLYMNTTILHAQAAFEFAMADSIAK